MENQNQPAIEQMLQEENEKLNLIKLQMSKLDETMESLKLDYINKHNQLLAELNKKLGSVEILNRILYAQKENPKT
jgi:hypothetical protein